MYVTRPLWPVMGCLISCIVSAFQIQIVLSSEQETICFPLGEKATELTLLLWPVRGWPICCSVSASQTQTVLSYEPETICFPLGEKATDLTQWLWPITMAYKRLANLLQCFCIPDTNCLVIWARNNLLSIGWESNRINPATMACKGLTNLLQCFCIPDTNCLITWPFPSDDISTLVTSPFVSMMPWTDVPFIFEVHCNKFGNFSL